MSSFFSTDDSVFVQRHNPVPRYDLNPAEASTLVQNLQANSDLLGRVRVIPMKRSRVELPVTSVANNTMDTTTLTSSSLLLPWTVTAAFITGMGRADAAKRVLTLATTQAGNDLEDLLLNGDETSNDILLRATDGVMRKINKTCATGYGGFTTDVFENTLRALPTEHRQEPRKLTFIVGPDTWQDYASAMATRMPLSGGVVGVAKNPTYGGIEVMMSPMMPKNKVILSNLKNLLFGIEDTMNVSSNNSASIPSRHINLAIKLRVAFGLVDPNAAVLTTYKTA